MSGPWEHEGRHYLVTEFSDVEEPTWRQERIATILRSPSWMTRTRSVVNCRRS